MTDAVDALILDLLEWVDREERTYAEVIDAWRTSCPRLPVWEEANARGLVTREFANGCAMVCVTDSGRALVDRTRPTSRGSLDLGEL